MDDLISRQAAIDALRKETDAVCDELWEIEGSMNMCEMVRSISSVLDDLPSAEPECNLDEWCADCKEYDHDKHCCPRWNRVIRTALEEAQPERKKGRWIDGQCSICGCDIPAYIIDWKWQKDMDANFCPNCGAYMRGGEK